MQTKLFNQKAEEIGKISLKESVFGAEFNEPLIHQVVVATLANLRQGTKSTLTRTEVSGGGKKPWKQKGTGQARQGSTRSPQWIHGGVVFAPKPRDFSQKINKQMKKSAFVSAISTILAEKNLIVVDELKLKEAKTKDMEKVLSAFSIDKKAVIVTAGVNENVVRAASNIPSVYTTTADLLSTLDIVNAGKLLITKEAIEKIQEAYAE